MSSSLCWRKKPVDPEPLNGCGHPFKGIVLQALGYTESDLRMGGGWAGEITKDSAPHIWLRGYLEAMRDDGDEDRNDRRVLEQFLADLDREGVLELGVFG